MRTIVVFPNVPVQDVIWCKLNQWEPLYYSTLCLYSTCDWMDNDWATMSCFLQTLLHTTRHYTMPKPLRLYRKCSYCWCLITKLPCPTDNLVPCYDTSTSKHRYIIYIVHITVYTFLVIILYMIKKYITNHFILCIHVPPSQFSQLFCLLSQQKRTVFDFGLNHQPHIIIGYDTYGLKPVNTVYSDTHLYSWTRQRLHRLDQWLVWQGGTGFFQSFLDSESDRLGIPLHSI